MSSTLLFERRVPQDLDGQWDDTGWAGETQKVNK